MGAGVALAGKRRCAVCRGQLRRRRIGSIPADSRAPTLLSRLQAFAQAGNVRAFQALLAQVADPESPADRPGDAVTLKLVGCAVCGSGYIELARPLLGAELAPDAQDRMTIDPGFAAALGATTTGTQA